MSFVRSFRKKNQLFDKASIFLFLQRSSEVFTSKFSVGSEFLFNSEKLVIFGQPFRTAWCTSFDLTSSKSDHKISNKAVLSFTRSMGYHGSPAIFLSKVMGSDGFCNRANLIYFQKQTIAGFFVNGHLNSFWIGNSQIVSNNLNIS